MKGIIIHKKCKKKSVKFIKEVFRKCKCVSMYDKDIFKQKVMIMVGKHIDNVKSVMFSRVSYFTLNF
jgi:hypothetical protein